VVIIAVVRPKCFLCPCRPRRRSSQRARVRNSHAIEHPSHTQGSVLSWASWKTLPRALFRRSNNLPATRTPMYTGYAPYVRECVGVPLRYINHSSIFDSLLAHMRPQNATTERPKHLKIHHQQLQDLMRAIRSSHWTRRIRSSRLRAVRRLRYLLCPRTFQAMYKHLVVDSFLDDEAALELLLLRPPWSSLNALRHPPTYHDLLLRPYIVRQCQTSWTFLLLSGRVIMRQAVRLRVMPCICN
jgi:hypothetical protein